VLATVTAGGSAAGSADPRRVVLRRDGGLYGYERALRRAGFAPVAGIDEAGRGACAGPLVVAAVVLPEGRRGQVPGLADSKLLTERARERVYDEVCRRASEVGVVAIEPGRVDEEGLHRSNLSGMRRALAALSRPPAYVLTDGFGVGGLGVPGLGLFKGDQVSGCVAAASVLAKVTRDRLMTRMHQRYPAYDFAAHKGYVTERHAEALAAFGPCAAHRRSFVNVARAGLVPAGVPSTTFERLAENAAALAGAPDGFGGREGALAASGGQTSADEVTR
jgi:ribonuclease HII